MQIGQTIWAIDPMKSFFTGNNQFTVGKAYKVETFDEITFYVKCDTGELKGILKTWFNTYFSLTPPNEKELKMELNYLKVLLPVVKEDLQTSYAIVGHESTAIKRFVSKVEELINSQS